MLGSQEKIQIKIANSEREFEQIHRLNYRTFVDEIPQHKKREDRRLVDVFHDKNNYVIATINEKLIGMLAYNTQRPFSLDKKGVDINSKIPAGTKIAEIRLLAVENQWRKSTITFRLLQALIIRLKEQKIQMGFISATTLQMDFYKKIGFISFGELVGKEGAWYQPMYITFDQLNQKLKA